MNPASLERFPLTHWAIRSRLLPALAAVCLCLASAAEGEQPAPAGRPRLRELLRRFNETQGTVQSLTAEFTERKNLSLLAKPVVSTGAFFYAKPGRIKWEYSEPERRIFLITEDHYLAYYPAQKRAEEVPLSKFSSRPLFRIFGIGQTSEELEKFFDITLSEAGAEKGTFLLLLTPKRQRVKSRLTVVRFWVDQKTYLPRKLEYVEADGDSTILTFSNLRLNAAIAENRFAVNLPRDVQVTNSFSGFSGSSMSR